MILSSQDIHNHLLPDVDDGFAEAENSLKAIKRMADAGCKDFIFTPHLNPEVYEDTNEELLRSTYAEFVKKIPAEWGVKTSLAAEYMVVKDFESRIGRDELLTYPDGSILIEMSYYYPSHNLEQVIFRLVYEGYKPILAHPERYLFIKEQGLDNLDRYCDMGCRLQLNLMSLTGAYGHTSMRVINYLLDKGLYSFAATDLHSLKQLDIIMGGRPKGLFIGRKLQKVFGRKF